MAHVNSAAPQLAYTLAGSIFCDGMERDIAANKIRAILPQLLMDIAAQVQDDLDEYDTKKERDWVKHYYHIELSARADAPVCPCLNTSIEWQCAYYGCRQCAKSQDAKWKDLSEY